jgi:hypothetical protein
MSRKCRAFTLLDGMILVAATAGGFALWRLVVLPGIDLIMRDATPADFGRVYLSAAPIVLMELVGFMVIRLRQPRPRFRRIMTQPGTVSSVAALTFLIFNAAFSFPAGIEMTPEVLWSDAFLPTAAGSAVAMAWTVLALSRRCRRERGWIDAFGMILGCYWIIGAVLMFVFNILFAFDILS